MRMSFNQYIQNPMGIANSVISNREMYRLLYTKKLDKIMIREAGRLNKTSYELYRDSNRYIAYLKIPSEVISEFYYDVIIEFTEPKADKSLKKKIVGYSLDDYFVRFYANDPSFVFTFTHAFVKNDMFFKEFASKMSKRAIKEKANEKNPKDLVGYVKSIYFAYLIMSRKGLFNKLKYTSTYDQAVIAKKVTDADRMIALRQQAAEDLAKHRKLEKEKFKRSRKDHLENDVPGTVSHAIKKTKTVGNTMATKAVSKVTGSKNIKTTKRSR